MRILWADTASHGKSRYISKKEEHEWSNPHFQGLNTLVLLSTEVFGVCCCSGFWLVNPAASEPVHYLANRASRNNPSGSGLAGNKNVALYPLL